jgi:hypothetical protein
MSEQLSKNFNLSEFKNVNPDPRLLSLLQCLRNTLGLAITITDSARTVLEHISLYKKLSYDTKIKTYENGLSNDSLLNIIPWGSRHLPSFDTPYLRAVDINVTGTDSIKLTGHRLKDQVLKIAMALDINIGLGVGKTFLHIDVDRESNVIWEYSY